MKRRMRLLSGALILLSFAFILANCSKDRKGSGWRHPSDLSDNISPDGQDALSPQVAMDNNGNAIVLWVQDDGSNNQIFVSEYRNGSWKHPSDLSDNISPDGSSAWPSQVAMDNNGNAIVLWQQYDSSNYSQIFMSEYRNGSWVHPSNLSDNISPDGSSAWSPQVTMDNNGNAIVLWQQYDSSNYSQIFMSEYRNGSWVHPSDLSDNISPDGSSASLAQVAMDNNGNAIVLWEQYDSSNNNQIFMSEYRNGSWVHPSDLSDNISLEDGFYANSPQVAMDNNGNAIVVWQQNDGSNKQIFMSEYRNGSWKHPSDLSDNISPDGQVPYYYNLRVAMDNNGNAIVVWQQDDGSNYQIFMSEYRNGSWKHPSDLSDNISPDGSSAWPSQVAMDNNGNAIVLWQQNDSSNYRQIFMSEYRNGTWVHPSDLSDNISLDGKDAIVIKVAMDNNGNAIVIWRQEEVVVVSSKKQIFMGPPDYYCQIFMSEYRNGTWVHPSDLSDNISLDGSSACTARVAMDNNGNTIVVWYQDDGSNYRQIFMSEYR